MNNTSLTCIAATAGTRFGQDIQIENCHYQSSIQNFIRHSRLFRYIKKTKYRIPPNCWFGRQAIDQYSSLLYYTYWGFFRPNVVDRPLSHDYGYQLEKSLPFLLLTEIKINILKRTFFIPFFYKGFFPYFKVAKLSFTHLYTTTTLTIGSVVVRLACVKYLDSVQSEPSSNSKYFFFVY